MLRNLRLLLLSAVSAKLWKAEPGDPIPSDHFDLASNTYAYSNYDVRFICIPFIEDQPVGYTFRRIGRYFRDGDPLYTIKGLDDMSIWEALECYAYGKQGGDGDVIGERPSVFDTSEFAMWEAWANLEGMPRK